MKVKVWFHEATFDHQEWTSENETMQDLLNMYCGRKTTGYLPDYDSAVKTLLDEKFPGYELLYESPKQPPKPRKPGDREIIY